jgi:hypothetical protein
VHLSRLSVSDTTGAHRLEPVAVNVCTVVQRPGCREQRRDVETEARWINSNRNPNFKRKFIIDCANYRRANLPVKDSHSNGIGVFVDPRRVLQDVARLAVLGEVLIGHFAGKHVLSVFLELVKRCQGATSDHGDLTASQVTGSGGKKRHGEAGHKAVFWIRVSNGFSATSGLRVHSLTNQKIRAKPTSHAIEEDIYAGLVNHEYSPMTKSDQSNGSIWMEGKIPYDHIRIDWSTIEFHRAHDFLNTKHNRNMVNNQNHHRDHPKLVISFRGIKVEEILTHATTVEKIKAILADRLQRDGTAQSVLTPSEVKLLWKGKALHDDDDTKISLYDRLATAGAKFDVFHIIATGVSAAEKRALDTSLQAGLSQSKIMVRDDLSEAGIRRTAERQRLGRQILAKSSSRRSAAATAILHQYGFGSIHVLPDLPDKDKALSILTRLAQDPGILACMAKYKWKVGSLAELYPDGKVGESPVCVMGLNQNQGQIISLRLRTDDLRGFRKPLSIRRVLYHELAHNVHSQHDGPFFQLMRQIEKECNALDWTAGAGLSSSSTVQGEGGPDRSHYYSGGVYRLGSGGNFLPGTNGSETSHDKAISARELAARAALGHMTEQEEEVVRNCGCGREDLMLSQTKSADTSEHNEMDTSVLAPNPDKIQFNQ